MPIRSLSPPPRPWSRARLFAAAELAELKAAVTSVKDEVIKSRKRMEELWMANSVISFKKDGELDTSAAINASIQDLCQVIAELKTSHDKDKADLKEELADMHVSLKAARVKMIKMDEHLKSSEVGKIYLEKKLESTEDKLKTAQDKVKNLEDELKTAEDKVGGLQNRLVNAEDEVKNLKERLKTEEKRVDNLQVKLRTTEDKLVKMEAVQAQSEEKRKANKYLLRACGKGDFLAVKSALSMGADADSRTDNWSPLEMASFQGNITCVRILLEAGAPVNANMQGSWTALHYAAQEGSHGIIELLLKHGADTKIIDIRGRTPLMIAVGYGHASAVQQLLENGADIKARDWDGEGISSFVGFYRTIGQEAVLKVLKEWKANVNKH